MKYLFVGALVLLVAASGCTRSGAPDGTIPDEPIISEGDLPEPEEPGEPDTNIGLNQTQDGNLSLDELLAQQEFDFSDQLDDAESEEPEEPDTTIMAV